MGGLTACTYPFVGELSFSALITLCLHMVNPERTRFSVRLVTSAATPHPTDFSPQSPASGSHASFQAGKTQNQADCRFASGYLRDSAQGIRTPATLAAVGWRRQETAQAQASGFWQVN